MATKKDSVGVESFLSYMVKLNGKRLESFPLLEKKFGITPYESPGNRCKKLWRRFVQSNLSIKEFMDTRFGHYAGDGVDGIEHHNSEQTRVGDTSQWDETDGGQSAYYYGTTERCITSVDEAIKFAKIDLTVWDVYQHRIKTYDVTMKLKRKVGVDDKGKAVYEQFDKKRTNYAVALWLRKIDQTTEQLMSNMRDQLDMAIKTTKLKTVKGNRQVGVVNLADFHMGANVRDLLKTPDFNWGVLVEYLNSIAEVINSYEYSEVHVNMLGDYFESISGLNHLSTFKSLDQKGWGSQVIIDGAKILVDFLRRITNLVGVNMISGNHDRMSANSKEDNDGSAAHLLFSLMETKFEGVKFTYHPHCLPVEIDGIMYILTHGHQKMNGKSIESMIWKYGKQGMYNIWLSGHIHTRKTEKTWISQAAYVDRVITVSLDECQYRKIVVPSIFTGNAYSEMLGYTTTPGFVIIENNGKGKPNVHDITI